MVANLARIEENVIPHPVMLDMRIVTELSRCILKGNGSDPPIPFISLLIAYAES